jgi:hypothetical protein
MGLVADFYTSNGEDGHELTYHNQSECGYGKEVIRNGHYAAGRGTGRSLCSRCIDLAAEASAA